MKAVLGFVLTLVVALLSVPASAAKPKPTPTPSPSPTPQPPQALAIPVAFPFRIDQPSQDSQILYPQQLIANIVLDNVSAIEVRPDLSQCTGTPEMVLLDCTDASCTIYGIAATVDLVTNPLNGWQISVGEINETGTIPQGHYLVWSPHNDACSTSLTVTRSAVGHVVP